MMIIAINYADQGFKKAQKWNSKTALQWGADRVIEYGPDDIERDFLTRNESIFAHAKGAGCYLWKPYILYKAWKELGQEDVLVYTDSGSIYINKIQYLVDCMDKENQDIMVFSLEKDMLEKKYTKRDAFILMGCDSSQYTDTPQSIGGYVLLRKKKWVEDFLLEDLRYAQDARIITDEENIMGKENYNEFISHRHDQSVWSLMSKRRDIKRFRDPSQFGLLHEYEKEVELRSDYPQIILSHRKNVSSQTELRIKNSRPVRMLSRIQKQTKNRE